MKKNLSTQVRTLNVNHLNYILVLLFNNKRIFKESKMKLITRVCFKSQKQTLKKHHVIKQFQPQLDQSKMLL